MQTNPRLNIRQVTWANPVGADLRAAQQAELEARLGRPDHEPGPPPSEADTAVFLVARRQGLGPAGGLRRPSACWTPPPPKSNASTYCPTPVAQEWRSSILAALEAHAHALGITTLTAEAGSGADRRPAVLRGFPAGARAKLRALCRPGALVLLREADRFAQRHAHRHGVRPRAGAPGRLASQTTPRGHGTRRLTSHYGIGRHHLPHPQMGAARRPQRQRHAVRREPAEVDRRGSGDLRHPAAGQPPGRHQVHFRNQLRQLRRPGRPDRNGADRHPVRPTSLTLREKSGTRSPAKASSRWKRSSSSTSTSGTPEPHGYTEIT